MRRDAAAPCAVACHQMREFVQKRAFHLTPPEGAKLWVENDQIAGGIRKTRSAAHAGIPKDRDFLGKLAQAQGAEAIGSEEGEFRCRRSFAGFCALNQNLQGAVRVNGLKDVKG